MAKRMQSVKFQNVVEMLDYLPDYQRIITLLLRDIVKETLPLANEKLSYNVPFFYGKKRLAFIWPGAIPWGSTTFEGVQFGLCRANLIEDELNYLNLGSRKEVSVRTFSSIEEINVRYLQELLLKAWEIDSK